ncbi:MAG: class III poly(R)-hydroxyalkanoic acid synthase subunit PhaE [Luteimonas sp.]
MRNDGVGQFGMPDDLQSLARQYWGAWGEAMRAAAPGALPSAPASPWQQPLDWWTAMAKGGRPESDDALDRFNAQSQPWLGMMQQVAAQFVGRDAGAADIANAWRQAISGIGGSSGFNAMRGFGVPPFAGMGGAFPGMGGNPFASLLQGMQQGPGQHGFEHWLQQVSPWLQALQDGVAAMPQMGQMPSLPQFGVAREQQEQWQALAQALQQLQPRMQAYNALMLQATQDAFGIFESKLAEHEQPGRQLGSARALFDLWIDAAEEAYAKIAMSLEFRGVYGELVDAQMRVRAGVQCEVERLCAQFGMPTRTELDGAHRKIVELERQMRRLRDGAAVAKPSRMDAKRPAPVLRRAVADAGPAPAIPQQSSAPRSPPPLRAVTKADVTETTVAEAKVPPRDAALRRQPSASSAPAKKTAARPRAAPVAKPTKRAPTATKRAPARSVKAAHAPAVSRHGSTPIFIHASMPVAPRTAKSASKKGGR